MRSRSAQRGAGGPPRAALRGALAAAALLTRLAFPAQATAPTPLPPVLLYGDESVADCDGARGNLFNPAAVGLRYPSELVLSWARFEPRGERNWELASL